MPVDRTSTANSGPTRNPVGAHAATREGGSGKHSASDGIRLSAPSLEDGKSLWRLARDAGLDVNSPYAYVLWCRDFATTTVVATDATGTVRGFVMGYVRPEAPDTYFLWQVAVDPALHGQRLGRRMLDRIGDDNARRGLRYLEATVTPDNDASRALFASFARRRGADLTWTPLFERAHFPQGVEGNSPHGHTPHDGTEGHEREELVRIGPLIQTS